MIKRFSVALLAVLLLGACDEAADVQQAIPDQAEQAVATQPGVLNPAILPAYKLPGEEYVPGKQDASSDFRALHPQWYAITDPPPAGFRPMKEWEPMEAVIITYSSYLPGDNATAQTIAEIAIHSVPVGEVWVIVNNDAAKADLEERMKAAGITDQQIADKVKYFDIENDAIWQIDYGPLPLVNDETDEMVWSDFRYYHPRHLDDAIPTRLANMMDISVHRAPIDYEGGNFQADGEEFCYTTERLYQYTGLSYDQVKDIEVTHFGCKDLVVLKDITDDGTGHIDMFFKLAGKHTAFVGEYTVVNDSTNKARMDDNVEIMEGLEYSDGSAGIKVYRIPFPNPGGSGANKVPRTYINSTLYVSADGQTKVNLWPMYTVDKDLEAEALDAWEEGLPGWDHIGIVSDQISLYSGAIHCVSRTVPAKPFAKVWPDGTCENGACVPAVAGGYNGACIAGSEPTPGCWGPEWECLCNRCDVAGCAIPESCGDGTCDAAENCFSCAQDCACGVDEVCNVVTGQCGSDTCGNGICEEGENCLSCEADCGCSGGDSCAFGICTSDPCGGITYDGCCDGPDTLVYCDNGDLVVAGCDGAGCGWLTDQNWYDCTGSGEDPTGTLPRDCHNFSYPPGCEEKECGDNGGGYSCGECPEGLVCNEGVCGDGPACSCEGLECGDDGCGNSCGECDEGSTCEEGVCVAGECSCEGLECGDDGCGNSCGDCAEGFVCEMGKCIEPILPVDGDDTDVVTGDDVPVGGDDTAGGGSDATGGGEEEEKGDGGGSCSTAGGSGGSAGLFLALAGLFLALATLRRRSLLA